jgi:hypothetical protein
MTNGTETKMDFMLFISGVLMEGMMALGAIENPVTKKTETDLRHASQVIDMLDMIKEKTAGNLTDEESSGLDRVIHQMRMLYVKSAGDTEDK